jgi:cell division protein FtsB
VVSTRRPRVPKSAQREFATVGAGAAAGFDAGGSGPDADPRFSPTHPVGGHSAKVIPLDAVSSRHAVPRRPEPLTIEDPTPDPGADPMPEGGHDAEPAGGSASAPTPEQRRAAERQNLLRRSARQARRIPRAPASGAARAASHAAIAAGHSLDPTPDAEATETGVAGTPEAGAIRTAAGPRTAGAPASPGTAARPAKPVEPVPARNFTGRSVAFLVVLFVAAVLLAPTLRVFLDQQSELRTVQADIASQRETQQQLTDEIARWDDPAYIQQQARERFNLVLPGEQTYMVIGGEDPVEDPVPAPASPSDVNPDMPWADALWDSVVRAGTD